MTLVEYNLLKFAAKKKRRLLIWVNNKWSKATVFEQVRDFYALKRRNFYSDEKNIMWTFVFSSLLWSEFRMCYQLTSLNRLLSGHIFRSSVESLTTFSFHRSLHINDLNIVRQQRYSSRKLGSYTNNFRNLRFVSTLFRHLRVFFSRLEVMFF